MFTEQQERAFTVVDEFLNELANADDGLFYITYGKPSEYFLAKDYIEQYRLITYRTSNSKNSLSDITENGLAVIKAGGIKEYLTNSLRAREEKEKLEFEKLNVEIIDLRNRLFDYESTKKRIIRSEWIAIFSVVIALIALISQLK